MTLALTFDLPSVAQLAEHADTAAAHWLPSDSFTGPVLLLSGGSIGFWLTSNGLPHPPAPTGQPGRLDRPAVFADPCPPDLLPHIAPGCGREVLVEVFPLYEPTDRPLLTQLRAGVAAGHTAVTLRPGSNGLDITLGRRRHRTGGADTAGPRMSRLSCWPI